MMFLVMVLLMMLLAAFFVVVFAALATVLFTALGVSLLARTSCAALVATLLAAAACPGDQLYFFDGCHRIVALNHQFTASWFLLCGEVPNGHAQTRPRMQGGREGFVHQPPMTILVFEGNFGYVQVAVADVAHRDRPELPASALHSAEVRRASHGKFS
jgi:type IV secretory pathway VirB6-like protein